MNSRIRPLLKLFQYLDLPLLVALALLLGISFILIYSASGAQWADLSLQIRNSVIALWYYGQSTSCRPSNGQDSFYRVTFYCLWFWWQSMSLA